MTEWKTEICGKEKPEELESVSHETYIQRRNIVFIEKTEDENTDGMQIEPHYECESRFINKSEYEMLKSITAINEQKAIDEYTMQLIESGVI